MIRSCFVGALGLALLVSACDYAPAHTGKPAKSGSASKGTPHTDEGHAPNPLPRGKVFLATGAREIPVKVEIAATPPTRQRGLMFRQSLPEDEGMLFLFPVSEQLSFWMKNTYLPLDMIFIKSDMSVLGVVEGATPLTEDSRAVPGESQYVLEVNATFARRHNIGPGTKVRFEGTELVSVE